MATLAKICGLSTPEAVEAALAGGAAFVGFVFFAKSPRNLNPAAAARLAEPALGRAKVAAVVTSTRPDVTMSSKSVPSLWRKRNVTVWPRPSS